MLMTCGVEINCIGAPLPSVHSVLLARVFFCYCRAVFKREDLHLSVVNRPRVTNDRLYGLVVSYNEYICQACLE